MSFEDDLKAALEAEAATARVPAREILGRVRQSGRPSIWRRIRPGPAAEVLAVCAVLGLLIAVPFLRGAAPPQSDAGAAAPGAAPPETVTEPTAPVVYEGDGYRLRFPAAVSGPEPDDQGNMLFTDAAEPYAVTIRRRPRQPEKGLEDLLGDLVAENAKQSQRLKPIDLGIRMINGRNGVYIRVAYVSAAGGFARETAVIPAGAYEYVVACGSQVGSRASWETVGPYCQQELDGLEVDE